MTFPSIALSSSSAPTFGTSTPHFRSRVTALGLNPSPNIRGSTISPFSVITALLPHLPFTRAFCIQSSRAGCTLSSRIHACVEGRTEILCVLFRLHRGLRSEVGEEKVKEHLSHWSPRASYRVSFRYPAKETTEVRDSLHHSRIEGKCLQRIGPPRRACHPRSKSDQMSRVGSSRGRGCSYKPPG
jgi:hypothetical protein